MGIGNSKDRGIKLRAIDTRIWYDQNLLSLSANARLCFFHLLTNRYTTSLPGLFHSTAESLAADLRYWSVSEYLDIFDEIEGSSLVRADWQNGVISIPRLVKIFPPDNQNMAVGWCKFIQAIPECPLRDEHVLLIRNFLKKWKDGSYIEAFDRRLSLISK